MSTAIFVTEKGEELTPNEMIQQLMKRVTELEERVKELENPFGWGDYVISSAYDDSLSVQAAQQVPYIGAEGTDTITFNLSDER